MEAAKTACWDVAIIWYGKAAKVTFAFYSTGYFYPLCSIFMSNRVNLNYTRTLRKKVSHYLIIWKSILSNSVMGNIKKK